MLKNLKGRGFSLALCSNQHLKAAFLELSRFPAFKRPQWQTTSRFPMALGNGIQLRSAVDFFIL